MNFSMEVWSQADTWISLLTLTALEVVLGIDNIIFISILSSKLPEAQRPRARRLGLGAALFMRLGLLLGISWIMRLDTPWFTLLGQGMSGKSLILLFGGLFLMAKATYEIFGVLEVEEHEPKARGSGTFGILLLQIMVLDLVFSLDSVITAVGMVEHISVMFVAMVVAVGVMLVFANAIGDFVLRHPSMKVLALSFLLMVGVLLMAEAFEKHLDKGYVYFAMAFSLGVEMVNLRMRQNQKREKTGVELG